MRIGVMVGSDRERPRAARLAGLIADAQPPSARASPRSGFHRCLAISTR
jgi:hypothetical protein